jgi:phage terminase small subunit
MMTPKKERFVAEYLVDLNAAQAAIRTGYSPKTAKVQGSRLLSDADVQAMIHAARTDMTQKLQISREAVVAELAKLAFANPLDYGYVTEDGHWSTHLARTTRDQMAAVQEITSTSSVAGQGEDERVITRTTKLKLSDKRAALVDLGKHLGLFKEDQAAAQSVTFVIMGLLIHDPKRKA